MPLDNGVLDFDAGDQSLDLTIIPVKFKGKNYLLIEALADAVARWKNAQLAGSVISDQRTVSVGNMADSELLLLGDCLFFPDKDGNPLLQPNGDLQLNARVKKEHIKGWPNRVVSQLYDRLMAISGLNAGKETVESLEKKIAELSVRRNQLLKERKDKEDREQEASADEEEALAKN